VDIVGSYSVNWNEGFIKPEAFAEVLADMGEMKLMQMVRGLGRGRGTAATAYGPPVSRHGASGFAGRFTYELLDNETLRYGNTSRHARILHFGGTIVPKTAKALTVPVSPLADGKRAKDIPGLFRLPHTNLLVISKKRRSGKASDFAIVGPADSKGRWVELIVMFKLMAKVTINPHPYGLLWNEDNMQALYRALRRAFKRGA
jgi:hypothetical protein